MLAGSPGSSRLREPIRMTTARAFLEELHPSALRWGQLTHTWIFRGCADANYQLVPAALRPSALNPFTALGAATSTDTDGARGLQIGKESAAIENFMGFAD
jgi:hypothetical protein